MLTYSIEPSVDAITFAAELDRTAMLLEGRDELLLTRETLSDTPAFACASSRTTSFALSHKVTPASILKTFPILAKQKTSDEKKADLSTIKSIDECLNIGLSASVSRRPKQA